MFTKKDRLYQGQRSCERWKHSPSALCFSPDLISQLQLLISDAPVEPGRHFSRTESSKHSLYLEFEFLQSYCRLIVPVSLCLFFIFIISLSISDLHLSTFFFCPSSCSLRHQRCVFRRCDGASDADTDSGRVHAVSRSFLQCV